VIFLKKEKKKYNMYVSSQTLIPCSKATRRRLNVLKTVFDARNMNDTLNILIDKNEELKNVRKRIGKNENINSRSDINGETD